jgi:hypothetical protein
MGVTNANWPMAAHFAPTKLVRITFMSARAMRKKRERAGKESGVGDVVEVVALKRRRFKTRMTGIHYAQTKTRCVVSPGAPGNGDGCTEKDLNGASGTQCQRKLNK